MTRDGWPECCNLHSAFVDHDTFMRNYEASKRATAELEAYDRAHGLDCEGSPRVYYGTGLSGERRPTIAEMVEREDPDGVAAEIGGSE